MQLQRSQHVTKIKKKNTKNKVNKILTNKLNEVNKDIKHTEQDKQTNSFYKNKNKIKSTYVNKQNKQQSNMFNNNDNNSKLNINNNQQISLLCTKRKIRYNPGNNNKRLKPFSIDNILNNYVTLISIDNNNLREPNNYRDIFNLEDKKEWLKAVDEELNNMKKMRVFTLIDKVPKGANIVSTRWVFKYKKDSEGNIIKRKARLVARGYSQIYGVDYRNTFSPTLLTRYTTNNYSYFSSP